MKALLLAVAAAAALSACAFRTPHHDVTISVPEVNIDVRPEHRSRVHLQRHYVRDGVRYCHYSDGSVQRQHWRYRCALHY